MNSNRVGHLGAILLGLLVIVFSVSVACTVDDDCLPNTWEVCNTATSTCVLDASMCNADTDCTSLTCDEPTHQCLVPNTECTSSTGCSAGEYCDLDHPSGAVCLLQDGACQDDNSCTGTDECNANHYCVPNGWDCESTSECASGQLCDTLLTHQCYTPSSECAHDSDCAGAWEYCDLDNIIGHVCLLKDGMCQDNSSCLSSPGTYCGVSHYCIPTGSECAIDDDCATWEKCDSNVCVPEDGMCNNASDCDSGQTCNSATHQCITPSSECSSDSDCAGSWEYCDLNGSVPHTCLLKDGMCYDSHNCLANETCQSHVCVADIGGECTSDTDCAEWLHCNTTTEECDLDGGRCENSTDCSSGQYCNTNHYCKTSGGGGGGGGGGGNENECSIDSDCPSGDVCKYVSGHKECVAKPVSCSSDVDCDEFEYCAFDGNCYLFSGYCHSASDCASWEDCISSKCAIAPGNCEADSNCASYQACDTKQHACVLKDGKCGKNSDCESWEYCKDNKCILPNGNCVKDSDCAKGSKCNTTSHTCKQIEVKQNVSEVPLAKPEISTPNNGGAGTGEVVSTPTEEQPAGFLGISNDTWLYLIAGILAILLIGGAAYYLSKPDDEGKGEEGAAAAGEGEAKPAPGSGDGEEEPDEKEPEEEEPEPAPEEQPHGKAHPHKKK